MLPILVEICLALLVGAVGTVILFWPRRGALRGSHDSQFQNWRRTNDI